MSLQVDSEYLLVLSRLALMKRTPEGEILKFHDMLKVAAKWCEATESVTDCRDSKDNAYLELALASGAGCIVSGDLDLQVLHPWRGIDIVSPAEFVQSRRPEVNLDAFLDARILERYGRIANEELRLGLREQLKTAFLARDADFRSRTNS